MMTRVVLGGALGRFQGKEYWFDISTPREALHMINANKPGFINQIRKYMDVFNFYRVTCEFIDGTRQHLSNETFLMDVKKPIKCVRFSPIFRGSGKQGMAIVGAVIFVIGTIMQFTPLAEFAQPVQKFGLIMMATGVVTALTQPSKASQTVDDSEENFFFNGPVNTTEQAVPIPLVFGRCKVGSRVISSSITFKER